jgi:hypothetical protein
VAASLSPASGRFTLLPPAASPVPGRATAARRGGAATPVSRAGGPPARRSAGLLAVLLLAGCDAYVEGNGKFRQETRSVAAFEAVRVQSGIAVDVLAGAAAQTLVVSGDENVLQYVETIVRDGVLTLRVTERFDSKNPLGAAISVPLLRSIAAVDRSTALAIGVDGVDALVVEAVDGATVELHGSGGTSLEARVLGGGHGASRLRAGDYPVARANVQVLGGSTAVVDVAERVTGTAAGQNVVTVEGGGACEVSPASACTVPP